jgi:hypothetical protein
MSRAVFKLLIRNRQYASAQLYAFDLLELDGEDLRGPTLAVNGKVPTILDTAARAQPKP